MKRNRIYKDRRNQGNLKKNAICYIKRIRDIPERGGIIFLFESFYKARDLGKENVRKKENRNKNSVYHDFLAQKFARDLEFSLFSVFIWFPRRELLRQPVFADFFLFFSFQIGREIQACHVKQVVQRWNGFHHAGNKVGCGCVTISSVVTIPYSNFIDFNVFNSFNLGLTSSGSLSVISKRIALSGSPFAACTIRS